MKNRATLWIFVLELGLYGIVVTIYLWFVIHFLTGWLRALFAEDRVIYAFASLTLMIAQAVVLERVTTWVIYLTRRNR